MNTQIAIRTLDALASGMDPVTGEHFPEASPYNRPIVLRSLFVALKALQQPDASPAAVVVLPDPSAGFAKPAASQPLCAAASQSVARFDDAAAAMPTADKVESPAASGKKLKQPKTPRVPPANAGKAWTAEEDQLLCQAFDSGIAVKELAVKHSRSAAALNARLFKLGKITDPGFPLRMRPAA